MGMSQLRPHYRGYKSAGNLSDMRSSAELFRRARGKLLIDVKRSLTERRSQIRLPAAKRSGERKIREVRKPGWPPGCVNLWRGGASNLIGCGSPVGYPFALFFVFHDSSAAQFLRRLFRGSRLTVSGRDLPVFPESSVFVWNGFSDNR